MIQAFKALIYAIVRYGNDISSVVISKDVIEEIGQCTDEIAETFGDVLNIEITRDTYDCVYNGNVVYRHREMPRFYLGGIPVQFASCDNTFYIVLKNNDIVELISHTEDKCEEITFEEKELERIWYGGF